MSKIQVGQEVRILPQRRHSRVPDGGYVGTVTKIGRRYATAAYAVTTVEFGEERRYERTVEFDMDTGIERGGSRWDGDRVLTPEQIEAEARQKAAEAVLTAHRIDLRPGHGLTGEQVEALAELVKTFGQEE